MTPPLTPEARAELRKWAKSEFPRLLGAMLWPYVLVRGFTPCGWWTAAPISSVTVRCPAFAWALLAQHQSPPEGGA